MKKAFLLPLLILTIFSTSLAICNQNKTSETEDVSLKEVTPFVYCSIKHKGPYTEIERVIKMLMQATRNQNIYPAGPMIGIYYNSPNEVKPEDLEWEVGFPVTPQILAQAPLEKKQWNFTLIASALHGGPYEKTGETYSKIFEWMEANNYVQEGPVLERYLNMPTPDLKPEDLKTEIWVPCQKNK